MNCEWCEDAGKTIPSVTTYRSIPLCQECYANTQGKTPRPKPTTPKAQNVQTPVSKSTGTRALAVERSASAIRAGAVLTKEQYAAKFGTYGRRRQTQKTVELYERLRTLQAGQLLLLSPNPNESVSTARSRYSATCSRIVKEFKPPWRVKVSANSLANHVVIEKLL